MKVLTYILAGIGLITLGAIGGAFFLQPSGPLPAPDRNRVHEENVELVDAVELVPDSAPGRAVESRVYVADSTQEHTRFHAPQAHETVYHDARVITGHRSFLSASAGLLIFMAILIIAALVALRLKLNSEKNGPPSESADIEALHRQAQSLLDRMDALETILLERGRAGH